MSSSGQGASFLEDIIELAIAIELGAAEVYDTFARNFQDNEELYLFWKLYSEAERYHAATIRVHQTAFASSNPVDQDDFPTEVEESRAFLAQLEAWVAEFTATPATIERAFEVADHVENGAAEIHGRTQFFKLYPQFQALFTSMVEEDVGHRRMLQEAAARFLEAR